MHGIKIHNVGLYVCMCAYTYILTKMLSFYKLAMSINYTALRVSLKFAFNNHEII